MVCEAAKQIGLTEGCHSRWMNKDPDYPALFEEAEKELPRLIMDAAVRRSIHGVGRLKFFKGQPHKIDCDKSHPEAESYETDEGLIKYRRLYREYTHSDTILAKLLEAKVPGFKEAASSTNVNVNNFNMQEIIDEVERDSGKIIDADYVRAAAEAHIERITSNENE